VVAIFGNEEFENTKRKLKREYSDIIWLDDEQVQVKGIDIFGTTGVLDEPTAWQSKNVPNITKVYEKRLETIEAFVSKHPNCILLTHYAVGTYTIDPVPNPLQLTSEKLFQKVKNLPLTVIHGLLLSNLLLHMLPTRTPVAGKLPFVFGIPFSGNPLQCCSRLKSLLF